MVASQSAIRGHARVGLAPRAGTTRPATPAAAARSSAGASRLIGSTATIVTPSRPWTWSSRAWRFVPSPEAGRRRSSCRAELGEPSTRWSAGFPPRAADRPAQDLGRVQMGERAVDGQAIVGVLGDDLRATAAEDLHRASPADRGSGRDDHVENRSVEIGGLLRARPAGLRGPRAVPVPVPVPAPGRRRCRCETTVSTHRSRPPKAPRSSGPRSATGAPPAGSSIPRRTPKPPGTDSSALVRRREPSSDTRRACARSTLPPPARRLGRAARAQERPCPRG